MKKGFKDFDIDLKYGQIKEQKVKDMFENCTIEVKSERNWWKKTGNIAVEYEYRGKPSGIYATKSDYWFHRLEEGAEEFCTLVFKTSTLKRIVDKYKDKLLEKYFMFMKYNWIDLLVDTAIIAFVLGVLALILGSFPVTFSKFFAFFK